MAEIGLRVAAARVAEDERAGGGAPDWMCAEERRRWATLRDAGRRAFAASRRLLRETLAQATGLAADGWCVSAAAGVAPVASRRDLARHVAPSISIAHRLGWVAVAVGDAAVGIDIECDRPARGDPVERAVLMLAPDELADWQLVAAGDREAALLARWTAKEAWFKASRSQAAPWDFRRVHVRACAAADACANVRTWRAPTLHVAVCYGDARALAEARCAGLPAVGGEGFWHAAASGTSPKR